MSEKPRRVGAPKTPRTRKQRATLDDPEKLVTARQAAEIAVRAAQAVVQADVLASMGHYETRLRQELAAVRARMDCIETPWYRRWWRRLAATARRLVPARP